MDLGNVLRTESCGKLLNQVCFRETEPYGSKTSYERGLVRESPFKFTLEPCEAAFLG